MHEAGQVQPDIVKDKAVQQLITETNAILKDALTKGITDSVMPPAMVQALENNVYVFSGLKTYAQLKEASGQLLTADGQRKPFIQFLQDIRKIKENYNVNYLEAEYRFATQSANAVAKWQEFVADGDDYNLQYRTANDSKVRDSHATLNRTTLPKNDPFWDKYAVPNGWRCRCRIVQVLKDDYPLSNSADAIKLGEAATTQIGKNGKNTLEMFRFNPGKQQVIFPPQHPYTKVTGATLVKEMMETNAIRNKAQERAEQQAIYQLPYQKQFETIYSNKKTGGNVSLHQLARTNTESYPDELKAAKGFANSGANKVHINPPIYKDEKEGRKLIYKNLNPNNDSNPDLTVNNVYIDVKSCNLKNAVKRANQAASQGAEVCFTDKEMLDLELQINKLSSRIFYKNPTIKKVHFLIDGKIKTAVNDNG